MPKHELKTYQQASAQSSPWSLRQRIAMIVWEYVWAIFCAWTPKPLNFWRLLVLKLFGAKIHGKPFVHQRARIQIPWNITLHHCATVGDRTNLYSLGEIEICEQATVAQEAYVCTGTHDFSRPEIPLQTAKITIGAHAFVGARAFLMLGVTIGERAVVGAAAVVTKDVAPGRIVVGNPARVVGLRAGSAPTKGVP